MQSVSHKKKYSIEDYVTLVRANPIIKTYSDIESTLVCICGQRNDNIGLPCFKCNSFVHNCLAKEKNRGELYECSPCLNKSLDPLFQVRKVLVESYFRTQSIFEYQNIVNFQLILSKEDLDYPVQIRGIIPDKTSLGWPMQGSFYINDQKNPFYELKPLLINSNRKARREEYFAIPKDKLKIGKNYIRYKLPCLDKNKFTSKFQCEQRKIYYCAINSIIKVTASDLETQTFKQRRCEKDQSLCFLKQNSSEIQVVGSKVCLICPYTRERIKVPVRGRYCKHFSCVCLETLIGTHATSRSWGCPICEEKMVQPYVDVWIFNMLRDNQSGSEVQVLDNGTYSWIKQSSQILDLEQSQESNPVKQEKKSFNKQGIQSIFPVTKNESMIPQIANNSLISELSISQNIIPQVINLDDLSDQAEIQRSQKMDRRQMLKRISNKMKNQAENINQAKRQVNKSISNEESVQRLNLSKQLPSKQTKKLFEQKISIQKMDRRVPVKINPIIFDIKTLEAKQMRCDEFKRLFFKNRTNPYKKYINTEELRKLFRDIL